MFSKYLLLVISFIFGIVLTGVALLFGVTLHAQEKYTEVQQSIITRESVIADLRLWQIAGLDVYEPLQASYGLEPEAYRLAKQKYMALRDANQTICDTTHIHKDVFKKN